MEVEGSHSYVPRIYFEGEGTYISSHVASNVKTKERAECMYCFINLQKPKKNIPSSVSDNSDKITQPAKAYSAFTCTVIKKNVDMSSGFSK